MADVAQASHTQPKPVSNPPSLVVPPTQSLAIPAAATPQQTARPHGLSLSTQSPVTQYGSYEFDRIIKAGEVHKRTRKTKVCIEKPRARECFTKGTYSRGSRCG